MSINPGLAKGKRGLENKCLSECGGSYCVSAETPQPCQRLSLYTGLMLRKEPVCQDGEGAGIEDGKNF